MEFVPIFGTRFIDFLLLGIELNNQIRKLGTRHNSGYSLQDNNKHTKAGERT
jgi:hypothetical protein